MCSRKEADTHRYRRCVESMSRASARKAKKVSRTTLKRDAYSLHMSPKEAMGLVFLLRRIYSKDGCCLEALSVRLDGLIAYQVQSSLRTPR